MQELTVRLTDVTNQADNLNRRLGELPQEINQVDLFQLHDVNEAGEWAGNSVNEYFTFVHLMSGKQVLQIKCP